MKDGRRETRDRKQETDNGRQKMRDGRRDTEEGRQEKGDRRRETRVTGPRHVLNTFRPRFGPVYDISATQFFLWVYSLKT